MPVETDAHRPRRYPGALIMGLFFVALVAMSLLLALAMPRATLLPPAAAQVVERGALSGR